MVRPLLLGLVLSAPAALAAAPVGPSAGSAVCRQPQAPGERPPVCMDAFFEVLGPYGTWIQTDRFGTLFCPAAERFPPDFRPYSKGHWAMAEEGWTFVGDHPTSWVTDHYGRWVEAGLHGCTFGWVPGDVYSPAWVEFHVGENVIAWRPAPFDGVPVQLNVPEGSRLQLLRLGPSPGGAPSPQTFVAVKDGDFTARSIEDVALDGPERVRALKDVTPLPDARAGLHSQERNDVVAQFLAARDAQTAKALGAQLGEPPEPAARVRRSGPGVAGSLQKGKPGTGGEGRSAGPRPGDNPPGAGKVPWGGDQNQGDFTRPGPPGGVKVFDFGRDKKRAPLPPPRNPGEKLR